MHRIRFLAVLLLLLFLTACTAVEPTADHDIADAVRSAQTVFLGLPVTTQERAQALSETRRSTDTLPALTAVSADAPDRTHPVPLADRDAAPTYYLPLDMQNPAWDDITLSAPGCTVFVVSDKDLPAKADALADGHRFRLLLCGEHYAAEADLVCTGLPMLQLELYDPHTGLLTGRTDIERSPVSTMRFSFYDPCDPAADTVTSARCAGTVRIRGGTSVKYDKNSFRISLYDDFSLTDQKNLSLCGLRADDDWILNAMYQEETKVRDMLAYDLWEDIGADCYGDGTVTGTRMRYVEVLLGGKYWGLYGLCEPLDAKQFGISEEEPGSVYKVGSWEVPRVSDLRRAIIDALPSVAAVEVKYPDVTDDGARDAWKPFLDYVETTYESSDFTFSQRIGDFVDEDNLIDLWIHLNIIAGRDNRWKNLYLACRSSDGRLVMAPWDCDISFGLGWQEGGHESLHLFHEEIAIYELIELEVHKRYIEQNVNGFADRLAARWWELREDWLCEDEIIRRAHAFLAQTEDSGAMTRNRRTWPDSGYTDTLSYLEDFVRIRIPLIDAHIRALTEK